MERGGGGRGGEVTGCATSTVACDGDSGGGGGGWCCCGCGAKGGGSDTGTGTDTDTGGDRGAEGGAEGATTMPAGAGGGGGGATTLNGCGGGGGGGAPATLMVLLGTVLGGGGGGGGGATPDVGEVGRVCACALLLFCWPSSPSSSSVTTTDRGVSDASVVGVSGREASTPLMPSRSSDVSHADGASRTEAVVFFRRTEFTAGRLILN